MPQSVRENLKTFRAISGFLRQFVEAILPTVVTEWSRLVASALAGLPTTVKRTATSASELLLAARCRGVAVSRSMPTYHLYCSSSTNQKLAAHVALSKN